jgi:hypothetical protein
MATATGAYAVRDNVKLRLGRATDGSDTADDTLITSYCNFVNSRIEGITGRVLAPISSTAYTFDGFSAIEEGRCLLVPSLGVRTITLLEVAGYTGASFTTMPSTDYFIRPTAQERDPGWPGTEIWITDIPSASNTYPYFPRGFANVRITGTWGWPAIPDEIVDCAETVVVRAFQARRTGQSDTAAMLDGTTVISRILASEWRQLLERYTVKNVEIV